MREAGVIVRRDDGRPEGDACLGHACCADLAVYIVVGYLFGADAHNGHVNGPPPAANGKPVVKIRDRGSGFRDLDFDGLPAPSDKASLLLE